MSAQDLTRFAVPQRRPATGCIPTGYEILLRAAATVGIDFITFQDDFDLEAAGVGRNNFESVGKAIQDKYPTVRPSSRRFGTGSDKATFIEERLAAGLPTLVSIALGQNQGWHIVPVLGIDENGYYSLLWMTHPSGRMEIRQMHRTDLILRHDELDGGDDVAFLEP